MYDLIISIVTYNSNLILLNDLVQQINDEKRIKIKLIIADNLSTREYFNNLTFLKCDVFSAGNNLGYGRSHNLIESIAYKSKYILILNPDISLEKNTLFDCFNFLENNMEYVAISPILKKNKIEIFIIENRNFSFLEILKRRLGKDKTIQKNNIYNKNKEIIDINFISGAFMFFRRDIYKKVNGFDKRFFMYFEDIDICKRMNKYGKIGVLNYSFAFHKRSRDSYKSLRMMLIHLVSFLKYKFKIYKN